MHAKVTIASLVFGLSIGLSTGIVKFNTKTNEIKEENMVCNHDNHEHIHHSAAEKETVFKQVPLKEDVSTGHSHSYTSRYEYLNDGRHKAYCSCGAYTNQDHVFNAYYPYGHGHNDMIRCALCNTNIETEPIYDDDPVIDSFGSGEAKWYLFVPTANGSYTFETTGSSDTYGELYVGEYPTTMTTSNDDGGANHNFKITYNLTYGQNVFLRVKGYNWYAASYTLTVRPAHTHNYNRLVQYNAQQHKRVCSCGEYILQPHSYSSYEACSNTYHNKVCVCGHRIEEQHVFTDYLPYGHGHNDLIYCATCQNSVECKRMEFGQVYNENVESRDVNWYIFIPQSDGNYIFETTGDADTIGELYIGAYPSGTPIEDDDGGEDQNFKITAYLEVGDIAFLKVREYDWFSASYSISVVGDQPVIQLSDWTIMIYICGANLQSAALTDIQEILSVTSQPYNVNVILEIGGATSWAGNSYGISASNLNRYHVRNRQLVSDGKYTNASMGSQSTLESFLSWGLQEYPAQKTGVIFWDHGGALDGVCYDYNYGHDPLTAIEVSNAFNNVSYMNSADKFEFIGYDACLMQVQDIAEYNSSYCKYMVASEELEPGSGWAYDKWIDDVYAKRPTNTILTEIVNTYVTGNNNKVTLSAIDLSKMNAYYNEFESMASQIKTTAKSNWTTFKNILLSCKAYNWNNPRYYGTIDGYDFLTKLYNNRTFSSYQTKINTVMTKYNQLFVVRRCGSGAGQSNGLAIFCALNHYGNSMSYPTTRFTNWKSVVA